MNECALAPFVMDEYAFDRSGDPSEWTNMPSTARTAAHASPFGPDNGPEAGYRRGMKGLAISRTLRARPERGAADLLPGARIGADDRLARGLKSTPPDRLVRVDIRDEKE